MIVDAQRPVLITGGAGFIGTNLTDRLLGAGQPVLVYDNLSRPGTERNLRWLQHRHGGQGLEVMIADVRDDQALRAAVARACQVFHFAAQVAVTTSLQDPRQDFAVNAGGTLALLEAIRNNPRPVPLLYTSTNKVYGTLAGVALAERDGRHGPADPARRARGIGEDQPLDFHSPYGCSKGAADQYVLDYSRVFGLAAVVFRMSCIYGPHQQGNEDQGWVAHFLLQALADAPITIFGDGKQVRDLLYVDDLCTAMLAVHPCFDRLSGRAFNMGGGLHNTVSLRDVLAAIERLIGRRPSLCFADWRSADQRYYVSDTTAFTQATGWRPTVGVSEGLRRLCKGLGGQPAGAAAASQLIGGAELALGGLDGAT